MGEPASGKASRKKSRLSRLKNLRGKLLLVAGSVFLGLVMVELFLRIIGFSDPTLLYVYDHERGIGLRPFAEAWWVREGNNYVRINSQGLHDREHARIKPPGTLRIAVLGDSFAEALQVPIGETFWAGLERGLQQCPNIGGHKVEVLNFGVSGYGTAQELITLRERVWDYSPDIVLLVFTPGNDLNDNFKKLSYDTRRPYFVYQDGKLTLDMSTMNSREASLRFRLGKSVMGRAFDWLRRHLRVIQLLGSAGRAALADNLAGNRLASSSLEKADRAGTSHEDKPDPKQASDSKVANSNSEGPRLNEPGLDAMVYFEPVNETWNEAWRVTEALIAQMHDEVKSRGARFYLVTVTRASQVTPGSVANKAAQKNSGNILYYPERRIEAMGEREGFPVLNLAPSLKEYADKHGVYLHGFGKDLGRGGHWNQAGHRAVGESITGWLCAESAR